MDMPPALLGHTARQQQLANILATWQAPNDSAPFAQVQRRHTDAAILGNFGVLRLHPDFLSILEVTTTAVDLVFEKQGHHIREKRERVVPAVFESISYAMSRIEYKGGRVNGNKVIRTAVGRSQDGRWLLLGMKFIPAEYSDSRQDEAWGRTAYFFDESDLPGKIRSWALRPIDIPIRRAQEAS
jgi:hypothetical protein